MSLSIDQLAKPLKVKARIQETPESVSLVLEIPADLKTKYHYQAGQFVTFFLKIGAEQISRSYSLASSSLTDSDFKVTVKKVTGGRGSNFLCDRVKSGDTLMTTPPAGNFFKPSLEPKGTHYFLFAAGSGITPIFTFEMLQTYQERRAAPPPSSMYSPARHAFRFCRGSRKCAAKPAPT